MSSSLIRGTLILTLGTFISKFLGLFYVIPMYSILGQEGTALYQYGYVPYTIAISVATAGVPLAVSKFISKYNAMEEYEVGRKLFRSGIFLMLLTGFATFLILFALAPLLADSIIPDEGFLSTKDDVIGVIRAVSFALILVPFLSLIRGFFQGHESMGPSAVSQVVEQIVRIVFLLAGSFAVIYIFHGELSTAVNLATFAAFVGAVGGLVVLGWYWFRRKSHLDKLTLQSKGRVHLTTWEMYKELLTYAGPFILVGIANPLFQFIDQLTFNRAMLEAGFNGVEAEKAFSAINFSSHKLVMIPVSLAIALSLTLVPVITKSFVRQEYKTLHDQLNQTFQVLLFLTVPACAGLMLLAEPMYTFFYENDPLGIGILRAYAPVAILFALFSVTAAILQGVNEQRYTLLSLLVGLLVKLSLNIPLIKWLDAEGAIAATALGYAAAISINLFVIKWTTAFQYKKVMKVSFLVLLLTVFMSLAVWAVYTIFAAFFEPVTKLQALWLLIPSVLMGMIAYGLVSLKLGIVAKLFPSQYQKLKMKVLG
ncbi:O-antigen/teichoic acid export membrane protein [Bacillus oleivorans]|uniref:O-antigen/teichoic acid export membrane protein n=1 Tax=Bacillus oleivorans TaxID=1448271 RepID=A0A285CUR7_9BACI|nr:polysaccharide biosynthesis protein [Bacillus oleivorans]SNX71311.1 O-antigen/teichoic acid export membrane protein [Bacillus oleivorans]